MRTIFIGDVHGCYDELIELLNKLNIKNNDQVYFTGDLINKGPQSDKVVELVKKNNYRVVMGNHEYKFIKFQKFLEKKIFQSKLKLSLTNWISNFPYYIKKKKFLLVHAGFNPSLKIENNSVFTLLNLRTINNTPWHEMYHNKQLVIYGHWARQNLTVKSNSIGLDSGCVYGGKLSAYILEENKFIQVKAKKTYSPIED